MRVSKNIRGIFTIAGVAAIAWGAVLAPASAEEGQVTAAEETTTTTSTSTTIAPTTTVAPTTTTSTTIPTTAGDGDNDGVSNEPHIDFFEDGTFVDEDPTIAIINATDEANTVILFLDTENNEKLRKVTWSSATQVGNTALPSGSVSFEVVGLSGPVDVVTIWNDKNPKAHALFKGSGTTFTQFPTKDADFADQSSAFVHTIVDGGAGDADKTVNGVIVDPVGPGYVNPVANTATTVRGAALPRTGGDMKLPAASGFAAVLFGVILLAIAWKPAGGHYNFNK